MATDTETREALEALHAKVGEIKSSEDYLSYLSFVSRFHNYSAMNILWMMVQWERRRAENPDLPEFSQPAAFSAWKDLGRSVRKGEKALTVLAPIIITDKEDLDSFGKPKKKCVGFRLKKRTFDVSQTEGDSIPENPAKAVKLTGEADPRFWDGAVRALTAEGWSVSVEAIPGEVNGWCNHATKTIAVEVANDPAQRLKTLLHEFGHAMLHGEACDLGRDEKELEAESVAFCVAHALGMDSSSYSVPYLISWSHREDHGKQLTKTIDRVVKTSRKVIDKVLTGEPVPA